MYYSVPTLHSIAQDFYVSGEGVELLPFTSDQTGGKADAILKPGQIIHFRHTGKVRLHFHTHGWSGKVTIHAGGKSSEHDLYSQAPGELWVDFDVEGEAISDLIIVSGSAQNPASSGSQVWLRGVEVEKTQPWHPAVLPISPVAEAVIGKVGTFIVPHFDEVIGNSIKNTGIWAEKDIEFFSDVVRQGDTVLDIGANIGHHTVFFSKAVGVSGRVIAFEPQLNIFRFASANLVVNGGGNTTLLQGCLGDACGELRMAPVSYDQTTNFGALGVSIGESSEGEIAPVWTLDSLVADGTIKLDRIDFVKIDVQSFELFVLRGAEETLRKFKPKIFLEISPFWMEARGYSYVTIYEFLAEMGYSFQHFSEGAGIKDGIRQWSGVETEEWDVFCCAT